MQRREEIDKIGEFAERLGAEAKQPGFLTRLLARFSAMWALMARVPLPARWRSAALPNADDMIMLPLVGGVLGLIAALPAWLLAQAAPTTVCAWVACGIYTVFGWSIHLDGWGDLWDGAGSGRRGEAMRRIMKDSCSGSFGVAGIALAIGMRATLLASIDTKFWIPACILGGGVGRFAGCTAACFGVYPWSAGMGQSMVQGFRGYQLFCALLAAFFLFPLAPMNWAIGMLCAGVAGVLLARWSNQTLGGTNGDVLGAASVLGELLALFACTL